MQVSLINHQLSVMPGRKDSDLTAEAFLRDKLLLPGGYVRKLFSTGRVRVHGQAAHSQDMLKSGQKIWIEGERLEGRSYHEPFHIHLDEVLPCSTIFEDRHLLVVDKPANLIVHSDHEQEDTLDRRVACYYARTNQNLQVLHIHRLDKGTTGVLLYGKHGFISRALDEELRNGLIKRTYLAVTFGKGLQKSGEVNAPIGRDRHQSGRFRISSTGKEALTKYKRLSQLVTKEGTYSLVACQLDTGRTHQIRVHLGSLGAPIVGDALYGGKIIPPFVRPNQGIGLHALSIRFYHPYEEKDMDVFAPLPSTFEKLFKELKWSVSDMSNVSSVSALF